jgi:hypothetical protein
LFFGGLAELLAIHRLTFDADDPLLTSVTGAKIISTATLNCLLETFIAAPHVPAEAVSTAPLNYLLETLIAAPHDPVEASSSTCNCIANICQVIYDETYRGRKLDTSGTNLAHIGERIYLSILTFLRSNVLLLDHCGVNDAVRDISQKLFSPPALMASLTAEATEANAVCQSILEILRAEDVLDAGSIFVITLGQTICGKFSCGAYNVKEEQYQTKHTRLGCNCSFMSIEVRRSARC